MLNRTNRKLSAKNTGLNLGTRSLANLVGANKGGLTLHFAARFAAVRVGVRAVRDDSRWAASAFASAMRSYPSLPGVVATVMPTGSSPQPQPPHQQQGPWAGLAGQTPRLASLFAITMRTLPTTGATHRCLERFTPRPEPTPIPDYPRGKAFSKANLLLSIPSQVPDITP